MNTEKINTILARNLFKLNLPPHHAGPYHHLALKSSCYSILHRKHKKPSNPHFLPLGKFVLTQASIELLTLI